MKVRFLITLAVLLPTFALAHDIPVPHDHFGVWSSWEAILAIAAVGLGLFFIVRKQMAKNNTR